MKNMLAFLVLSIALASCHQSSSQYDATSSEANLAQADSTNFAQDISPLHSASRKLVHTADIRCRVKNVHEATQYFEGITNRFGGLVQSSETVNNTLEQKTIRYKNDSLRSINIYETSALLTLRIPVALKDSFLQAIPKMAGFIDHRKLALTDETYHYLGNALKNDAQQSAGKQALAKAKTTEDVLAAHGSYPQGSEAAIDRKMENLDLLDRVNYATVTLSLYEPQRADVQVVSNTTIYDTAWSSAALLALQDGWKAVTSLLLLAITLWPLWLTIAMLYMMHKKGLLVLRRKKAISISQMQ